MAQDSTEGWVRGLLAKRGEQTVGILISLVTQAMSKGTCSANDVAPIVESMPKQSRNSVGAAFKLARRVGLTPTGRVIQSTGARRHGGAVREWAMENADKARAFLRDCRGLMVGINDKSEVRQGLLNL